MQPLRGPFVLEDMAAGDAARGGVSRPARELAPCASEDGSSAASRLAALAFGTLLALVLALGARSAAPAGVPASTGPIALWAADRDACRLLGLDRDLIVARQVPVEWPVDVEACDDGGAWVLRSSDGTAGGVRRLARFTRAGALELEIETGIVLDLAVLAGDDALLLEADFPAGTTRALRVDAHGVARVLAEGPGLLSLAASEASVLLGTADGVVSRIDLEGVEIDRASIGGRIGDLAPGPSPGSAWALDVERAGRVVLLDLVLDIVSSTEVGFEARHLAPVSAAERVWVAATTERRARRFGPGGVLEIDLADLPLAGIERALASSDGGVRLVAPGAILQLDERGALLPGQGGFGYLADIAGVR